jgi:hypothetical protein
VRPIDLVLLFVLGAVPLSGYGQMGICKQDAWIAAPNAACMDQPHNAGRAPGDRSATAPAAGHPVTPLFHLSCYFIALPTRFAPPQRVNFVVAVDESRNLVVVDNEAIHPAHITRAAIQFSTNAGSARGANWFINRINGEIGVSNSGRASIAPGRCDRAVSRAF